MNGRGNERVQRASQLKRIWYSRILEHESRSQAPLGNIKMAVGSSKPVVRNGPTRRCVETTRLRNWSNGRDSRRLDAARRRGGCSTSCVDQPVGACGFVAVSGAASGNRAIKRGVAAAKRVCRRRVIRTFRRKIFSSHSCIGVRTQADCPSPPMNVRITPNLA